MVKGVTASMVPATALGGDETCAILLLSLLLEHLCRSCNGGILAESSGVLGGPFRFPRCNSYGSP